MLKAILGNWLIPATILVLILLSAFFFGAGWAGVIVVMLFCLTLALAIFSVLQEQKKAYRENRITRAKLTINVLSEVLLILLAMTLAAWLGRAIAEIATQQMGNDLIKFIAGLVTGMLVGMGVGFLVKQSLDRLATR